jgi:hypothetical protein
VRIAPGFNYFKLVVPHLKPGVVGPYSVRGTWFPNRLPLEEVGPYPDSLSHNRWPMVPGVQDPDSHPQAFHRAGGQGCSLDGRQNRYSCVTTSTSTRLGGKAMGTHHVAPKATAELKA